MAALEKRSMILHEMQRILNNLNSLVNEQILLRDTYMPKNSRCWNMPLVSLFWAGLYRWMQIFLFFEINDTLYNQ